MNQLLCRLCYGTEAIINIFQDNKDVTRYTKIKHCCRNVEIQENDGLPMLICSGCDRELDACYRFLLKCEAADQNIRTMLLSGVPDYTKELALYPKSEIKTEPKLNNPDDDCHDAEEQSTHTIAECKGFNPFKLENKQDLHKVTPEANIIKNSLKKRVKVNKEDLICSVCSRKCLNSSALMAHMRTHTNERPFKCTLCNKAYKDRGTLKRHVDRNHLMQRERKFMCENCGKSFYSKCDIQTHMRVHTGETPYACPVCPARFTQMSAMLRHKRRHTDQKSYMCATCGKPFWTKEELKKHFTVHEDTRKFSCPICLVQFKHKGSIQKHMRIHSEPNRFICNHCGKTFNNKGNLKSHMDRKHSERSGCCKVCSKHVSDVAVHMWRHTGHRPLKCQFCTSSFYEMKALGLHINFKHKKADKFKCSVEGCSNAFPSKPMLMFHVAKFHERQTPYPCARCARGFYRKNDLARHMLGTHKERLL